MKMRSTWKPTAIIWLIAAGSLVAADKPVFLYSRYYNAKGETRYEPDGAFKDVLHRLGNEFEVRVHDKPLTREILKDVNLVLIANPSDKAVSNNAAPAHLSTKDTATLTEWIRGGGGLIVTANQEAHNLELDGVNRLLSQFGLQFTNVYTDFKPIAVPKDAPIIGGLRWGYYSGNQIIVDKKASGRARAVVSNDATAPIKGTRNAPGVLMATAEPGKGRVIATTDTGWLTDNALSGEGIAGAQIKEQDNWEIFRRLATWAAGK